MSFLSNMLFGRPSMPKRVATDIVIPLHSRDDTPQNRNISIEFTMRFDDVLDTQKLADALWKLLEKPGWRKLGARLRMNSESGKLEYHIPAQYTQNRPPINFTWKTHRMRLEEHPIGNKFPTVKDSDQIQVFDILFSLRGLTQTEGSTVVLDDWLYTDKAQLGLHVVNFEDATLVTMTWLHTLLDVMGRQALLTAWKAVLEGRDEDVPEFWGYDFDPLEKLGAPVEHDDTLSKDSIADRQVSGIDEKKGLVRMTIASVKAGLQRFLDLKSIFTYLYSRIFKSQKAQSGRMLYMPASYMARLRASAMRDLASLDPLQITYNNTSSPSPKPFLSDGDIFSAWLTRHLVACNPTLLDSPPPRPLLFLNVLGTRDVLSTATSKYSALIPKGKAYVGNCTAGITSQFTLQQFLSLPLGHVAARLRKDVVGQATREAVEASQRAGPGEQQTSASPPDTSMAPVVFVFSNWAKAKLFDTDFSAAVVDSGGKGCEDGVERGKPTFITAYGTDARVAENGVGTGGLGNCIGKDAKGGYWLAGMFAEGFEEGFEKAVLSL
ncbi:lysr family regulatory protein [Stemphylium lycopersici]|uniref:Lysr family regulatory protein n=1 Tax=Stemphylium lycopersici TaxID=183478 RepID=A0A364N5R7_STELY|nr:lysr family regulatory protein [Stemphylium lycopersici]RAR12147.1 lysr family regulatory protein [Stemphylium lycopersici]